MLLTLLILLHPSLFVSHTRACTHKYITWHLLAAYRLDIKATGAGRVLTLPCLLGPTETETIRHPHT